MSYFFASEGYWYRILPKDGLFDNITFAAGVEWEHLLPLLLECGFIKIMAMGESHIVYSKWLELQNALSDKFEMQVSTLQPKGASK